MIAGTLLLGALGVVGSQDVRADRFSDASAGASRGTNVSPQCQAAMIELHGQRAWDRAVAEQAALAEAGGATGSARLSPEEIAAERARLIETRAPIGTGLAATFLILG